MADYNQFKTVLEKHNIYYKQNEPMSNHTSFKIGGCCDVVCYPNTIEKAKIVITKCSEFSFPYFVLGKGSNLLVCDDGFEGVAISSSYLNKIELISKDEIYCESGVSLGALCNFAFKNSLCGMEFAYGIPGTVGGAVFMNAGAYGGEIKDVILSAKHIDSKGNEKRLDFKDLDLSYRHSVYENRDDFIVSANFKLKEDDGAKIKARMDEVLSKRKQKQPLDFPSAGSTFKRPQNGFAAALIEQCGLKGLTVGGARVSEKHSGFIINIGNATCKDVDELIEKVKHIVKDKTGVLLEPEVKRIG